MKALSFLFSMLIAHLTQAQISLTLDTKCVDFNPVFKEVEAIDMRDGQKLLGFIHKGFTNRPEQITFDGNIADSVAHFFKASDTRSSNSKQLVLILNELFMNENTNSVPEIGRLKLSARLFIKNDSGAYSELLTIDSIYTVKGFDVTKKLFRLVSDEFCNISKIAAISEPNPNSHTLTRHDLEHLDSLEISKIPIFSNERPVSGVFKDYSHFKINRPDIEAEIIVEKSRKGKLTAYRIFGARRKKVQLTTNGFYAISDGMNLFKATPEGLFKINKIGQKLFYDRPGSFTDPSNVGIYFGMAGAMLSFSLSPHKINLFRFKINHRRGNSIPVGIVD
ncbi:MAG: hypothetical protein BGO21_21850 [Dyadobacter sp. 50-39]|uniref:hypothetical protein n=1 Tax=Dyadobacter sp. 50-39 TaxID=1895756 RepID=UPI000961D4D9|nr:hypothetical protein [Dyadobacter sp. 50-39]OJV19709.1 MAG: hypothetical protein BGO21_21850 [Dyadobacter sp. 50-39]